MVEPLRPFAVLACSALALAACSGDTEADAKQGETPEADGGATDVTASADLDAEMDALAADAAAGEAGSTQTDGPGGRAAATRLDAIPAAFRGTWARSSQDCAARNHNRLTIAADAISLFEGGGDAATIRRNDNALAVTLDDPAMGPDIIYLARESDRRIRVRMGDIPSRDYVACTGDQGGNDSAASSVPARFRATYALDRQACAGNYEYQPAFQNIDVTADRVMFFENGGPVESVNVTGDNAAITYTDTYADQSTRQALYLRLNGDGTTRIRQGRSGAVRTFVTC